MRVAALYDVHGNLPALEAVLAAVEREAPDVVLVGGDVAAGPMPAEVLERLRALGPRALFIRGNADREVVSAEQAGDDVWSRRAAWARERLSTDQLRLLEAAPETLTLDVDGLGRVLFCHGSPRSDEEILTRLTSEERLREILAAVDERVVVCGHTHVQFDRTAAGVRVVNAGSVGLPYEDEAGARWALLGPDVELRRTEYDVVAAAGALAVTGYPEVEELVRENVLARPGAAETSEFFERMATERSG